VNRAVIAHTCGEVRVKPAADWVPKSQASRGRDNCIEIGRALGALVFVRISEG
jgi:hypothetical protein